MEGLREIQELEIKRASILSEVRFSLKYGERPIPAPPDKYNLVHAIFFFFGVGSMLSLTFFITANGYWMYKFRDVSSQTVNATNRTTLQAYFASGTSITQSVPAVISTLLTSMYGHKVNIRSRTLYTTGLMFVLYSIFAAFIKINTDSWQLLFFCFTLGSFGAVAVSTSVFMLVGVTFISKFPITYMKTYQYGQGFSGLLSAILQIISLSVVEDTESAALIYFLSGAFVLMVTFILGYISKYSARFRFYLGDTAADTEKKIPNIKVMKSVAIQAWPVMFIMITMMFLIGTGHPNITSLVVSENYGHGNVWNDKYFVPVATFLAVDIYGLMGRYFAGPYMTPRNAYIFVIIQTVRLVVFSPAFMLCNAQPRHHLPVIFPHDWEYMVLLAASNLIGAFITTCSYMSMSNFAGQQTELAFLIMTSTLGIMGSLSSLLSPVFVKLL